MNVINQFEYMYSNKKFSVFGAFSPGYTSFQKEEYRMNKLFQYTHEVYRVYQPYFTPQQKQPPILAEVKVSTEHQEKELDFSQMLKAEIQALY